MPERDESKTEIPGLDDITLGPWKTLVLLFDLDRLRIAKSRSETEDRDDDEDARR